MVYLRRWNWIWLLPCTLLLLMPDKAEAQMTQAERDCAESLAKETSQKNEEFRKAFDETVRQFKEGDTCQYSIAALIPPKSYASSKLVTPLLKAMQPKLMTACFASNAERLREPVVGYTLLTIITETVENSLPEPLCTPDQLRPRNNAEDLI